MKYTYAIGVAVLFSFLPLAKGVSIRRSNVKIGFSNETQTFLKSILSQHNEGIDGKLRHDGTNQKRRPLPSQHYTEQGKIMMNDKEKEVSEEFLRRRLAVRGGLGFGCQYLHATWSNLPPGIQEAAEDLQYTQIMWDNGISSPLESLSWSQLTERQQAAARAFGYDEALWDRTTAWDHLTWDNLPVQVQMAAVALGYNEPSWNNGTPVSTKTLSWSELSTAQQEAARILGFDQASWNRSCESDSRCFSPIDEATVFERGSIMMKNLAVGDKVLTKSGEYKTIFTIDHLHPHKPTTFIQIYTTELGDAEPLEVTPNHLVFVEDNMEPVPASSIQSGSTIQTVLGPKKVIQIKKIVRNGLYNLITTDGTIVVNGIIASTYTSRNDRSHIEIAGLKFHPIQKIIAMTVAPYSAFCSVGGVSTMQYLCNRHDELAEMNTIMRRFEAFWTRQNDLVRFLIYFAYMTFFGVIGLVLRFLNIILLAAFFSLSRSLSTPRKYYIYVGR